MGVFIGNVFMIDWTDGPTVIALAKQLASGNSPPQIVFWNGKNYQITFAEQRAKIEAKGYSIVYSTGGKND